MSLRDIVIGVSPGVRGPKGGAGDPGRAATFNFAFSSATVDADPGGGSVAFNNADLSLVTEIYFDDHESGGANVSAWLDLLTSTGNTDNRGELHFQAIDDAGRFARFQVTGTVSSGVTYRRVSVTYIAHAGAFSTDDVLAMALYRVGSGQAATIQAGTTQTLPPGSAATVTNSGTAGEAVLDFGVPQGPIGPAWSQWEGPWVTSTAYVVLDTVENGGSSYICIAEHTAAALNEPGAGADWDDFWNLVAAKGADGTMSGPASSTTGNLPTFADASGNTLQDSGVTVAALLPRDGSAAMTGDLPMGSSKITGLAPGTDAADAVRFDQLNALAGPQARADIASATTTDIGAESTQYLRVTGTTTITGLGTAAAGVVRDLLFADALTLTHNATSLILPGGASITTAAGDTALFRSEGSGNWRCVRYQRADGEPLIDKMPFPQGSAGVGQVVGFSVGSGTGVTTPAGGTWEYWSIGFSSSTGAFTEQVNTGVAAGGTTVVAAGSGVNRTGMFRRIA